MKMLIMISPLCKSLTHTFFYHFPSKLSHNLTTFKILNKKHFRGYSSKAVAHAFYENRDNIEFTDAMDLRGVSVSANYETYVWLLEGCLNYGSLLDVTALHCNVLKLGFQTERVLWDRLFRVYVELGDVDGAVKVLDEVSDRDVGFWNEVVGLFLGKKMYGVVLGLFFRMVLRNVRLDECSFSGVLRACGGGNVGVDFVKQVHGFLICYGFGGSLVVCNPLIDAYSKIGVVDDAKRVFGGLAVKNSVSWVAMVCGLSQNRREEEAVCLFCEMHMLNVFPTPYVFSSALSACAKKELFSVGEQLHGLVLKFGFFNQTFICNALVTLYIRRGNFISAEQIFSKMQARDAVSYNSLISGLAQCGYSSNALGLFTRMQLDNLKPDCVTVASLLSACSSTGALHKGLQLHAYAIKAGMVADIITEGALLDLYVNCSDVKTAYDYFLTTTQENVVLWNVMLVAYGQLGNLYESFLIFREMQVRGIIPNEFTYPSILRTCTSLGALALGEQIHTQVIKTGYHFNVYVSSVLIDMYAKLGQLNVAHCILRRLTEKDVVSWTAMIAGYAQHDFFAEALKLFEEMLNRGIRSDNIGFASAISACAGIQALNQGQQIHAQSFIHGYSHDLSICNALVSLYARCGRINDAYLAFARVENKDSVSWNSLISGFAQSGYCEEALSVFSKMNKDGVDANIFTFGSAVSAAANLANMKQGKQIHAMIIKTGYEAELEASNVLITFYAKCGSLRDAKRQFMEMPVKNDISWNAIITGYSQHGCGKEVLCLYEDMIKSGLTPNHVTFVGVLSACSHVGLVNEGLKYFESMNQEYSLLPKSEHYVCIVDLLSRRGLLHQAKDFVENMPTKPDAMIWRTLLSACTVYKNLDIGEFAAHHLLELEPHDSASYVLSSNMYAAVGKWDCRDQTRQMMKDKGVKKEPGRSWVEIKSKIHAFYASDRLHPLSKNIYDYLEDLTERAREVGYVQDRFSLLIDAEQKQDPMISIHSEKLAISFGLLSLHSSAPLHVFKNLRVCNDCHNWIKFVSKISNRPIVVRDAYRFHHFDGGLCSCRDYW